MAPRHYYRGNPTFATFRRYYQGSPNLAAFNLMIGVAVAICLWKIWVPAMDEVGVPTTTTTTTLSNPNQHTALQAQSISIYDESSQRHVLPIQMLEGRPVVLLSPQMLAPEPRLDPLTKTTTTIGSPNRQKISSFENSKPENLSPINGKGKGKMHNTRHRNLSNKPTFASERNHHYSHENGFTTTTTKTLRGTVILLAISGSLVTGAYYARKALEKIQRWEEQSNEDSLAFDMAYTDTVSEINYGSFVSSWDGGDLDKFDI